MKNKILNKKMLYLMMFLLLMSISSAALTDNLKNINKDSIVNALNVNGKYYIVESAIVLAPLLVVIWYILNLNKALKIVSMIFAVGLYSVLGYPIVETLFSQFQGTKTYVYAAYVSWIVSVVTIMGMKYKGKIDKSQHLMTGMVLGLYSAIAMPGFGLIADIFPPISAGIVGLIGFVIPFFNLEEKVNSKLRDAVGRVRKSTKGGEDALDEEEKDIEENEKANDAISNKVDKIGEGIDDIEDGLKKGNAQKINAAADSINQNLAQIGTYQQHCPMIVPLMGFYPFAQMNYSQYQQNLAEITRLTQPKGYFTETKLGKADYFVLRLHKKLLDESKSRTGQWILFQQLKNTNFKQVIEALKNSENNFLNKKAKQLESKSKTLGMPQFLKMLEQWHLELNGKRNEVIRDGNGLVKVMREKYPKSMKIAKEIEDYGKQSMYFVGELKKWDSSAEENSKMIDSMTKQFESPELDAWKKGELLADIKARKTQLEKYHNEMRPEFLKRLSKNKKHAEELLKLWEEEQKKIEEAKEEVIESAENIGIPPKTHVELNNLVSLAEVRKKRLEETGTG